MVAVLAVVVAVSHTDLANTTRPQPGKMMRDLFGSVKAARALHYATARSPRAYVLTRGAGALLLESNFGSDLKAA